VTATTTATTAGTEKPEAEKAQTPPADAPAPSRARLRRRLAGVLVGSGFKAAPGPMTGSILLNLLGTAALVGYPVGYRIIVDAALSRDAARVVVGVVVVAVLFGAGWLMQILAVSQATPLTDRITVHHAENIAGLVNEAPWLEHFERPELLREVEQVRDGRRGLAAAPRQITGMVSNGIRFGVTAILLATVYLPVLLVPLAALAPVFTDRRAARIAKASEDDLAEQRRLLGDLFTLTTSAQTAKELRTYGIAHDLATVHRELSEKVRVASVRSALRAAAWEAAGWLLYAGCFVTAIIVLVLRATHGEASAGQVVMVVSLLRRVQTQLSSASDTAGALATTTRNARRLLWLEEYSASVRPSGTRPAPDRLADGIRLDGVGFKYPGAERAVLDGIDLALPAGSTVALVGENGAGKTTLIKLLTGMYAPTAGSVLVDGADLTELDLAAWRQRLSATFQDFVRYQLTARQAVGLGDLPRLSDDDAVRGALERAEAADLLAHLPDGLDTQLGKYFRGGRELSGGQWQRIGLARGLMRPRPLLTVLDEPTASLDAATESAIFERYVRIAQAGRDQGSITLFVSHRFSTVRSADLIVLLDKGRIVESGDHDSLIAADGEYARLYHLQARAYLDGRGKPSATAEPGG